ncbi:hypothetical protein TNCV_649961 [Trichonephila clavipes]|nr:hypothetical protein TNCV_649961 [Trichonephila clavipes]
MYNGHLKGNKGILTFIFVISCFCQRVQHSFYCRADETKEPFSTPTLTHIEESLTTDPIRTEWTDPIANDKNGA